MNTVPGYAANISSVSKQIADGHVDGRDVHGRRSCACWVVLNREFRIQKFDCNRDRRQLIAKKCRLDTLICNQ